MQPDTIIPDLSNPQSWNRYSYVQNRPINFNDPTGHWAFETNDPIQEQLNLAHKRAEERAKERKDKNREAGNGNDANKYGSDPGIEFTIGPVPPIPPEEDDPFSSILFWLQGYDWLELLDQTALFMQNYGVPAYRHAKGVVPGGPALEFLLGFATTFLSDLNNPDLSWLQRLVRPTVIGAEDAAVDAAATTVAAFVAGGGGLVTLGTGPGAAFTAGVLFFGTSYGVSKGGDWLFGALNENVLNETVLPGYFPKKE